VSQIYPDVSFLATSGGGYSKHAAGEDSQRPADTAERRLAGKLPDCLSMSSVEQAKMTRRDCPKDIDPTSIKAAGGASRLPLDSPLHQRNKILQPNIPAQSSRFQGLDYAIRATLIRQLLGEIESVCETAPDDDLRFLCVVLGIWRRLRSRRKSVAAVLPSFVVTLSKLTCFFRVPGDCGVVIRRYLACLSQTRPVDGCE
jgi:hypothetical protein